MNSLLNNLRKLLRLHLYQEIEASHHPVHNQILHLDVNLIEPKISLVLEAPMHSVRRSLSKHAIENYSTQLYALEIQRNELQNGNTSLDFQIKFNISQFKVDVVWILLFFENGSRTTETIYFDRIDLYLVQECKWVSVVYFERLAINIFIHGDLLSISQQLFQGLRVEI